MVEAGDLVQVRPPFTEAHPDTVALVNYCAALGLIAPTDVPNILA